MEKIKDVLYPESIYWTTCAKKEKDKGSVCVQLNISTTIRVKFNNKYYLKTILVKKQCEDGLNNDHIHDLHKRLDTAAYYDMLISNSGFDVVLDELLWSLDENQEGELSRFNKRYS